MGKLLSPTSTTIVGLLESCPGRSNISSEITRKPDGTFEFEYAGGTEMFWDDQRTVEREGQRVFLDEDGDEWLERELILVEDTDDVD